MTPPTVTKSLATEPNVTENSRFQVKCQLSGKSENYQVFILWFSKNVTTINSSFFPVFHNKVSKNLMSPVLASNTLLRKPRLIFTLVEITSRISVSSPSGTCQTTGGTSKREFPRLPPMSKGPAFSSWGQQLSLGLFFSGAFITEAVASNLSLDTCLALLPLTLF